MTELKEGHTNGVDGRGRERSSHDYDGVNCQIKVFKNKSIEVR